jgi:hypothetical protein
MASQACPAAGTWIDLSVFLHDLQAAEMRSQPLMAFMILLLLPGALSEEAISAM